MHNERSPFQPPLEQNNNPKELKEAEKIDELEGAVAKDITSTVDKLEKLSDNESQNENNGEIKKCRKKLSKIMRSFFRLTSALTFVGITGGIAVDQLVNRENIITEKTENGKKYRHSDEETTHLLNYLAGKENLTEDELISALKNLIRDLFENVQKKSLPEDFDNYTLEQLDDFMSNNGDTKMPKGEFIKFVREETKKECPRNADLYEEIWQLEEESGAPKLRINTSYVAFAKGKDLRANYNGLNHTIYLNTPFVGCELDEFLAEMAHAQQFSPHSPKRYTKSVQYLYGILQVVIRARLNPENFVEEHTKTYKEPGTIEYEAHEQIERDLKRRYKKLAEE